MSIVRDHIASFPSYQTHYSKSENPNRKYLLPDLNVLAMYDLYKEKCMEKDTCTKYDVLDKKTEVCEDVDESRKLNAEKELHLRKVEKVREARDRDTVKARGDESFYGFTFYLEKALLFPVLKTSVTCGVG
ncbi:hypothetical protein HHI36_007726 [Cryptolaemus montrouzieri]|uniref:Uncharacterized protein n=1 Tax=Cryptolaemus montrouzieri TaxID=559131 RepID=A0ABD2MQF1_9CUCU